MAFAIQWIHPPEAGQTGQTLRALKISDQSEVQSGVALTESGTVSGVFSGSLTATPTEDLYCTVSRGGLVIWYGLLRVGQSVVSDLGFGLATAAALQVVYDNVDEILIDTGTTLPAQISGISGGGGSGSGARTITITVDDGTTPLQNAIVRMTEGSNTYTATTDVNGEATFNLDDATYTVAITKSGYSYAGTSLVVTADDTVTYSMTALSITPSTGSFTTGYLTAYDTAGQAEQGVSVNIQMIIAPTGTGVAYDSAIVTKTSDVNGLVQFAGMAKGATYWLWRGSTATLDYEGGIEVAIPVGAGATTALTNVAGQP